MEGDGGEDKGHRQRFLSYACAAARRLLTRASSARREYGNKNNVTLVAILVVTVAMFLVFQSTNNINGILAPAWQNHRRRQLLSGTRLKVSGSQSVGLPGPFQSTQKHFDEPYFGGLDFEYLSSSGGGGEERTFRTIEYGPDADILDKFRPRDNENVESYHAYDDNVKRVPKLVGSQRHKYQNDHCRQTAMHREFFPTCNNVHAIDFPTLALQDKGTYLG